MVRAVVLLAAVVVLAGCGTDTPATTAQGSSSSSAAAADATSPSTPAPEDASSKDSPGTDEPTEDGSSVPADAPACATVWRGGTKLARDYHGCMAGGQFVAVDQEPCSFGQQLVRFGDHFYAVRGGPVNHTAVPLAKDRTYRGAVASCRA